MNNLPKLKTPTKKANGARNTSEPSTPFTPMRAHLFGRSFSQQEKDPRNHKRRQSQQSGSFLTRIVSLAIKLAFLLAAFCLGGLTQEHKPELVRPLLAPLLQRLSKHGSAQPPCIDVQSLDKQPAIYRISDLQESNYDRGGLSHITVAGARHHGYKDIEVWLQTFAPGVQTPIHRHSNEEILIVQRGVGKVYLKQDQGVMNWPLHVNYTFSVPPDAVHLIMNTGTVDLQLLVMLGKPPARIHTLSNWEDGAEATLQIPYYWDRECPEVIPPSLEKFAPSGSTKAEL